MEWSFFGQEAQENKESVLEQTFLLMYYCGFSHDEAKRLPIPQRIWFINRVVKEIKETRGVKENNDPVMDSMQGKRMNAPRNMQRV